MNRTGHSAQRRVSLLVLLLALAVSLVSAPARPAAAAGASTSVSVQTRAYQVALTRLGDPYRFGGSGPHVFDTSGLTWYAYRAAGHPIRRTIGDQYVLSSRHIAPKAAQRGDLVFFLSRGAPVHVGIYAGNGFVIHANSGPYFGRKVINERISFYWAKHFTVEYRRVR